MDVLLDQQSELCPQINILFFYSIPIHLLFLSFGGASEK